MLKNKKGQNTLEYVAVFTAIVAAVLVLSASTLRGGVSSMIGASASKITNAMTTFNTMK